MQNSFLDRGIIRKKKKKRKEKWRETVRRCFIQSRWLDRGDVKSHKFLLWLMLLVGCIGSQSIPNTQGKMGVPLTNINQWSCLQSFCPLPRAVDCGPNVVGITYSLQKSLPWSPANGIQHLSHCVKHCVGVVLHLLKIYWRCVLRHVCMINFCAVLYIAAILRLGSFSFFFF